MQCQDVENLEELAAILEAPCDWHHQLQVIFDIEHVRNTLHEFRCPSDEIEEVMNKLEGHFADPKVNCGPIVRDTSCCHGTRP
jgi:hypothetical protein